MAQFKPWLNHPEAGHPIPRIKFFLWIFYADEMVAAIEYDTHTTWRGMVRFGFDLLCKQQTYTNTAHTNSLSPKIYTRCQTSNHTKHIFNSFAQITAICFIVAKTTTRRQCGSGNGNGNSVDVWFSFRVDIKSNWLYTILSWQSH